METDLPSVWFAMAVLGCRSLVLVINNQVLNKIKFAVRILSRKGRKYDKDMMKICLKIWGT